jgi:hypothetical protein
MFSDSLLEHVDSLRDIGQVCRVLLRDQKQIGLTRVLEAHQFIP